MAPIDQILSLVVTLSPYGFGGAFILTIVEPIVSKYRPAVGRQYNKWILVILWTIAVAMLVAKAVMTTTAPHQLVK
jgi:hypothetical protein